MNPPKPIRLFKAAREVWALLQSRHMRGCIIGGLAVQRWGEPRETQDVDFTVLTDLGQEEGTIDALLDSFSPRIEDARRFALERRVLLLVTRDRVPVDVALAGPVFEPEVLDRATPYEFAPAVVIPTCSAEDLIIYKSIAARGRDLSDLEGVVVRQYGRLDVARIRSWLGEFALLKEDPDLPHPFEAALARAERLIR